jgi:hypothetical protein
VYDLTGNTASVSVGTDNDTAAFAVESIRRWWGAAGQAEYPLACRLLITADAGGSNGYRTRAWNAELAALAVETGLEITVCHFRPGTSKWNKVEHQLFSQITMNWRGRPLASRHRCLVQRPAGDEQKAYPRYPPTPRPGRARHPARSAPARQPERSLQPGRGRGHPCPAAIKAAC